MKQPLSTYRIQLHGEFGFEKAMKIADYLSRLGVSHVYASPYLQAAKGSKHGYDVVNHHEVNHELGGPVLHDQFCRKLGENGLGQILDIVPNHMAIGGRANAWWWDVLENGIFSRYASYFDIDWQSPEERLRNKVLLPILGDHYGRILRNGEIRLARNAGRNDAEFLIRYHEHELPIAPEATAPLLKIAAQNSDSDALAFLADSLERLSLIEASSLPLTDARNRMERHRDKQVIHRWLGRLLREKPEIAKVVDQEVEAVNRDVDQLDALLEKQNYRVAYWKTAARDLGYRRFFDINTLVGMRMEDGNVFADTHKLVLDWLHKGVLDGVRVDHPDGLRDPREYFDRLHTAAPEAWVVAEKILETGEELPRDWQVQGTTGYDFLNVLGGVFINPGAEELLTRLYREFTGEQCSFVEMARSKKLLVLRDILGSDVNRLTALFQGICEQNRDHRDYTRHELHHAIRDLVASFPIYRTYVRAERGEIADEDIHTITEATAAAKRARPDLDPELFEFLQDVLTLRVRGQSESEFVMRFQQFTGPAMAKGVEDTAFYSYNRFVALNEVGGDPGRFAVTREEFHAWCQRTQSSHPLTQLAGSTHDTKRSEDVRARLYALSEMPEAWCDATWRWSAHNEKHRTNNLPDRNTEYLLYQTLVGTWPITKERLLPYMEKACRENKQFTTWSDPNQKYEDAMRAFVNEVLEDREFLYDFEQFIRPVVHAGYLNSISQTLVRLTAPGVPDLYQGTELWDFSLVDPDNRRPVAYDVRDQLLRDMEGKSAVEIVGRMSDGMPKLWVIRQALQLRRTTPDAFGAQSTYQPLSTAGAFAPHAIAFARANTVVTVAPRFHTLRKGWRDTTVELPEGPWLNVLDGAPLIGGCIGLERLFQDFPAALLTRPGVRV